jgi:hypothetical protein
MSKLFFICVVAIYFLTLGVIYYKNVADEQEKIKSVYEGNNQILISKIRKVYDDKVATDKRIEELEKRASEDIDFDWHTDISSSPVIMELKK